MKIKYLLLLAFVVFLTATQAQWAGTNPVYTPSRISLAGSSLPPARFYIDGSWCSSVHAFHIRQPLGGCVLPDVKGDLVRVELEGFPTDVPALIVNNGGKIGIGTYSPITPLHVKGYGYFEDRVGIGTSSPSAPLHVVGNSFLIGNVGIGTTSPGYKLHVDAGDVMVNNGDFMVSDGSSVQFKVYKTGYVRAREVLVDLLTIPDYVFEPNYKLLSFTEYETYIRQNNHLPGILSAHEYAQKGSIAVGELTIKLLEKIEEQALYIIELNKKLETLEKRIEVLEH